MARGIEVSKGAQNDSVGMKLPTCNSRNPRRKCLKNFHNLLG